MISAHEAEVLKWYCIYMRYNMLFYVLHDPAEWKRLQIESSPKFFPVLVVRAPVPWHARYLVSHQYLERHYFNGNVIVRKIRDLWFQKYDTMYILPLNGFEYPLEPDSFEKQVESNCEESRRVLIYEWLPECADIFLEFKHDWRQYVPMKVSQSCETIEKFFRCVNMLLSMQLRSLVMKSLVHFKELIVTFKVRQILIGTFCLKVEL